MGEGKGEEEEEKETKALLSLVWAQNPEGGETPLHASHPTPLLVSPFSHSEVASDLDRAADLPPSPQAA